MPLNKIISAELETIAVKPSQYPDKELIEIAFAGRSNVGKSSLLNSLMMRKSLARTSSKPGKTRTINFYRVNDEVRLVDLPGYGYAVASKDEKDRWKEYIETYLGTRENLKAIVQVVDIRHAPSKDDIKMYEYIKYYGFNSIIVATKADKISKGKYQAQKNLIMKTLKADNEIIPFSSMNKVNLDIIRNKIEEML